MEISAEVKEVVVASLIELGITADDIQELYREPNWLGQKQIAAELSQRYDKVITSTQVRLLKEHFGIANWSNAEKSKAAKSRSPQNAKTKEKAEELAAVGLTKEKLIELYHDEGKSLMAITDMIIREHGITYHRNWNPRIFEYYGIEPKDKAALAKKALVLGDQEKQSNAKKGRDERMLAANVTAEDLWADHEKEGLSIYALWNKYGIKESDVIISLREIGKEISRPKKKRTFKEIYETDVEPKGWDKSKLTQKYTTENKSQNEIFLEMKDEIGPVLAFRQFERLMDHLEIKKTKEQIAEKQGKKSRDEKTAAYAKLKRCGFTVESAAKHFEENKSLTWDKFISNLNEKLNEGEDPFTLRWMNRHVSPHLSAEYKRLVGSSREELALLHFLSENYSGEILTSDRSLIAPYEVDFYLPELPLAIEFNGNHWHSDEFMLHNHGITAKDYHKQKREMAAEQGVNLIFVWEHDWTRNQDAVERALVLALKGVVTSEILNKL